MLHLWEIFLLHLWEILLHLWELLQLWEILLHLWELLHLENFITLVGPTRRMVDRSGDGESSGSSSTSSSSPGKTQKSLPTYTLSQW